MEKWWALYFNGSLRDQISLPVALWKSGACFSYLDESVRDEGAEFTLRSHSPNSERSLVAKTTGVNHHLVFSTVGRFDTLPRVAAHAVLSPATKSLTPKRPARPSLSAALMSPALLKISGHRRQETRNSRPS